jgi:hypothetical protein
MTTENTITKVNKIQKNRENDSKCTRRETRLDTKTTKINVNVRMERKKKCA